MLYVFASAVAAAVQVVATAVATKSVAATVLAAVSAVGTLAKASGAFSERPSFDQQTTSGFETRAANRDQVIKQDITPERIVYGRVKVSGPITYAEITGDKNEFLHIIVPVAAHRIESFDELFIRNDKVKTDNNNFVTTDKYKSGSTKTARIRTHKGAEDQTVDSKLKDESEVIGDDFRGKGIAYIYGRFEWDADIYGKIPQFSAIIKGKNDIYDFRDGRTRYTNNAALCIADYLMLGPRRGLGLSRNDFNKDRAKAAANECDEKIKLKDGGQEKRYACNGDIQLDQSPSDILEKMLTSMAGEITFSGGDWFLLPGVYRAPSRELDEDDLRTGFNVQTERSRRDSFNGVKGTYISPKNDWSVSDFPPVEIDSLVQEDNGIERSKEIDLPFTTSPSMAQRIGRILLERNRREITVTYPANLNALPLISSSTIQISNEDLGWNSKVFKVKDWTLVFEDADDSDSVIPGIDLKLQETDAGVYSWAPSNDENAINAAPTTNLRDRTEVNKPSNLSLTADNTTLVTQDDGTIVQRLKVAWDVPNDAFVENGGRIEIQQKLSSGGVEDWETRAIIPGDSTNHFIQPIETGVDHDVRIRSENVRGQTSDWVEQRNFKVNKKTTKPSDVTGLSLSKQTADSALQLTWNPIPDNDVSHYIVKFDNQATFTWDTAVEIDTEGDRTEVNIPPETIGFGDWRFGVRAVNESGEQSQNTATIDQTINKMFTNRRSKIVGDSTFTVPENVTELELVLFGGGGGGTQGHHGGFKDQNAGGGGGGSGFFVESVESVNPGDEISVTIGSAGTGEGKSGDTKGGDTSFGNIIKSDGGEVGEAAGNSFKSVGGVSNGLNGGLNEDGGNPGIGGAGGSNKFGTGGGFNNDPSTPGKDASGLAAGGGGGAADDSNEAVGGDATSGVCEVRW